MCVESEKSFEVTLLYICYIHVYVYIYMFTNLYMLYVRDRYPSTLDSPVSDVISSLTYMYMHIHVYVHIYIYTYVYNI